MPADMVILCLFILTFEDGSIRARLGNINLSENMNSEPSGWAPFDFFRNTIFLFMKISFQTKKTSDSESSRKGIKTDGKISFWRALGAQISKNN